MADQDVGDLESGLLSLPQELRDIIYEYTFTTCVDIKHHDIGIHNAGLLASCRRIRNEAAKLYYQRNIFTAKAKTDEAVKAIVHQLLKSTPWQNRKCIQTIRVHVTSRDMDCGGVAFKTLKSRCQRYSYSHLLRMLREAHTSQGLDLTHVLRAEVLCWNGKENEMVWTEFPDAVEPPRFSEEPM